MHKLHTLGQCTHSQHIVHKVLEILHKYRTENIAQYRKYYRWCKKVTDNTLHNNFVKCRQIFKILSLPHLFI